MERRGITFQLFVGNGIAKATIFWPDGTFGEHAYAYGPRIRTRPEARSHMKQWAHDRIDDYVNRKERQ